LTGFDLSPEYIYHRVGHPRDPSCMSVMPSKKY